MPTPTLRCQRRCVTEHDQSGLIADVHAYAKGYFQQYARAIIDLATTATAPGMATQGLPTYVSLS